MWQYKRNTVVRKAKKVFKEPIAGNSKINNITFFTYTRSIKLVREVITSLNDKGMKEERDCQKLIELLVSVFTVKDIGDI